MYYKKREMSHEDTDTLGRQPHEDGGRDLSYASSSRGTLKATRSWKRQRRNVHWRFQKEHGPAIP